MSLDYFERAKERQAYQPANARMCCRNCSYVGGQSLTTGYQCMKGGFFVNAYGICASFTLKPVERAATCFL